MSLEKFEKLEGKVKALLEEHGQLKDENRELKRKLQESQNRIARLEEKLDTEHQKRSEALGQVDEVIKLLENAAG